MKAFSRWSFIVCARVLGLCLVKLARFLPVWQEVRSQYAGDGLELLAQDTVKPLLTWMDTDQGAEPKTWGRLGVATRSPCA